MISKKKGFTLIELLVVIAIIGILSSVVLASLNKAREKSRDTRRIADLSSLQLALELYFDDEANYPATLNELETEYISAVVDDPLGGAYIYASSEGSDYHLAADLENGDNLPDSDAGCSSVATLRCFTTALTNGFDGDVQATGRAARYDRKN